MMLHSNVRGLCQGSGELARACLEFHPLVVACQRLIYVKTLLTVFVLLAALWQLDEIDLSMAGHTYFNIRTYAILFEEIYGV